MLTALVIGLLSALPSPHDAAIGDARLNDVCFVDAEQGWAVGDRGAIWHTENGGRQWRLQTSGVTCSLSAVCFVDAQIGWAAGGFVHPYAHTSAGVLLYTRDGGTTWTTNAKLLLPMLRRLRFFDPQHGWALGCRSAMFPTGVFVTDDGGRHWRPVPGSDAAEWLAADFLNLHTGALAGRNGTLAAVGHGEIEASRGDSFGLQSFVQLRLATRGPSWLVGDGGVVQTSEVRGATWRSVAERLPTAARHFDFSALAVRGPKCWIAGTPGTRVFHTPDAGRTWNVWNTGSATPLRAIHFIDDQRGWAVGDFGTILASSNGGQTWQPQRAGGTQAALLALFADPQDVPLELVARLAGNEGYLAAVSVVGRRDVEVAPRDDVHATDRLHQAVIRVGGSSADAAWRFPLRQAGLAVDTRQSVQSWDHMNNGRGMEELQAYLVRQIRMWRPEVIVTHDTGRAVDPTGSIERCLYWRDEALISLVHEAVLQAVAQAADARAFPAQLNEAGLSPWSVKKVYGLMPPGMRGGVELSTSQFAARLGRSLADAAIEPAGLLRDGLAVSPATLGFRLLINTAGNGEDRRDFFAGITLAPGGPARRELSFAGGEGLDGRQRMAQRRNIVQAIVARTVEQGGGSPEQLLAQIDNMTRDFDDDSRAQMLYQLADRYHHTGHWPLAAETFQVLAGRYPEHSLGAAAKLWLLQYCASREAAWLVDHDEPQKRLQQAITIGTELERTRPEWFAEPTVCFPLATAHLGLGQMKQAERLYQLQRHGTDRNAWPACAQSELRVADPNNRPMKNVLPCVKTGAKPRLDGILDDPVWQRAKTATLQSAQHDDGDWPATVMLAYDAEYLYVAADCRRVGPATTPPTGPRAPDADITARDRIELCLDVDRDYTTYYRLAFDQYGWTNDSFWGDRTWNARCFVAARQDGDLWMLEAAIPLAELTGQPPHLREVWALGIQRVLPGVGFQSWTTPAAIEVLPDGFGCLQFE